MKKLLTNNDIKLSICVECNGVELWTVDNPNSSKCLNWRQEDELIELIRPKLLVARKKLDKIEGCHTPVTVKSKGKNTLTVDKIRCSHCHLDEGSSPCKWNLGD